METWAWLTIQAPGSEFNDLFLMRVCYQLPVFALILSSYQWCTYSYVLLSIEGVEVDLPNSQERKTSDVYCHYRKTSRAHHTHTLRYHVCLVGVGALYYWKIVKLSEKKTAGLSLSCTVCYDVNIWGILSRGYNDWQKNSNWRHFEMLYPQVTSSIKLAPPRWWILDDLESWYFELQ